MEKKTMYVVVRFNNNGFHIYSQRNSNPEKMQKYMKELKAKPQNANDKMYVMSEENAHKEHRRFLEWKQEHDRKIVERALKKYWFADYDKNKEIAEYMEKR